MNLLSKVRTLVAALVHKPFAPGREKVALEKGRAGETHQAVREEGTARLQREGAVQDTERVADLITERQSERDVPKRQ